MTSRAFPFSTHLGCVAYWCDDRDIALKEMPTNPAWRTWRSPRVPGITKTVDGGGLEAELVFGAGAQWMTVLVGAPTPTRQRAVDVALAHGCDVIFDTILEADPAAVTVDGGWTTTGRWIALHSPFDTRGTSVEDGAHIARAAAHRAAGHRISLAGGIGPGNFAAVIAAASDIAVIGSSVSAADDPEGTAAWLRQQLS